MSKGSLMVASYAPPPLFIPTQIHGTHMVPSLHWFCCFFEEMSYKNNDLLPPHLPFSIDLS